MDAEEVLEALLDRGILRLTKDDGEAITFDDEFQRRVRDTSDHLADGGLDAVDPDIVDSLDEPAIADSISTIADDDPEFVGHFYVLWTLLDSLSAAEVLRVTTVLIQLQDGPLPNDGAQEYFFPISGSQIPTVTSLAEMAIIFVWRHDSRECELIKESFEELFEEPPEDVALFSVHHPSSADILKEEYGVGTSPVVLFMLRGEVDCRLYGAHHTEVYANELDVLRQRGSD